MSAIPAKALDHVALWVEDRDTLADFLCAHLGMHVIERDDKFTLVGADALRGKLTLFAAEGEREPGALERVVLRVSDLDRALAELPDELETQRRGEVTTFEAPGGLGLGLTSAEGDDYDIDHVVLTVSERETAAEALTELGFARRNGFLAVADKSLRLERGAAETDRPLLNHIALLVDSAEEVRAEAERRGLEVIKFVDAENTLAVFVKGPDDIQLEYVEHKPGFSLT